MADYDYQCNECGTIRPIGVSTESESELSEELEAVCGECEEAKTFHRYGGDDAN